MTADEIVERIMTKHWDVDACRCWICEAGRAAGLRPRPQFLSHNELQDDKSYNYTLESGR